MTPRQQGLVRHLLTAAGPLLVAMGLTDEATWMAIVGFVMALVGFIWSWKAPEKSDD